MMKDKGRMAAGLFDLADEDGLLEREILAQRWPVPEEVKVEGNSLVYRFGRNPNFTQWKAGVLSEFLDLADCRGPELREKVERYAKRWGVLELCSMHLLPCSHHTNLVQQPLTELQRDLRALAKARPAEVSEKAQEIARRWGALDSDDSQRRWPEDFSGNCPPEYDGKGNRAEPLEAWRFWARKATALLRAAASTHRGEVGSREHWIIIAPVRPTEVSELEKAFETRTLSPKDRRKLDFRLDTIFGEPLPWRTGNQWRLLQSAVNYWLSLGSPQPRCVLERGRPTFILTAGEEHGWLFAVLAAELFFAVTKAKGLRICSNCGRLYPPKQLPRRGNHTYCPRPECGLRAAWRTASAKYRDKLKAK
jgi:hypothetical protein